MKRNFVRGFAVVLAAVSMLVMPATAARADDNAGSVRKITVSGQGTVKVKPDVAYVTLGVQTDSKDAKEAQAQNTKLMNDVIEAVKALGIAEKDIQTSGYYMYP